MRKAGWWVPGLVVLAMAGTAGAAVAAPAAKGKPAAAKGPRFESVTFGIRHRVFHDFREMQTVKLNQDFPLGDSEFSGRVIRYLPDFQMDVQAHKFFSLSDQPRNPAFQVVVRRGRVAQDTTWAFLKSPPHFGARSYFAFQVLRIDFPDHQPLVADSALIAPTGSPHRMPSAGDSTKGR